MEDKKMTNNEACVLVVPPFPEKTPVAMAYVPFQQFGNMYEPEKGFEVGTMFPDLDKPFWGGRGVLK